MVHLLRIAFACFLLLAGLPANALIPAQTNWTSGSCSASDPVEVGRCVIQATRPTAQITNCRITSGDVSQNYVGGYCHNGQYDSPWGASKAPGSCPANSIPAGGTNCACSAGFIEKDGQCAPKKSDKCGELEGKPLGLPSMGIHVGPQGTSWMSNAVGTTMKSCFPGGCQVEGSVSGCLGGGSSSTYCEISAPSFNGSECDDSKPPETCPAGTEPSAYVPGLCIPKANDCPAGYVKSKYADVCIPDDQPNDPNKPPGADDGKPSSCPSGRCPSKYVKDLCIPCETGTKPDGSTVTCVGANCTITKPDGTTEDKDKATFCEENPDSPLCVKGEFGGSCSAGFQCKGDAIQCSIAQEQHRRSCAMFDQPSPESELYNAEKAKGRDRDVTLSLPGNETVNVANQLSQQNLLGAASCISDLSVTVWGAEVVLPFSKICPALEYLGWILVAVASLAAFRIVSGTAKEEG